MELRVPKAQRAQGRVSGYNKKTVTGARVLTRPTSYRGTSRVFRVFRVFRVWGLGFRQPESVQDAPADP